MWLGEAKGLPSGVDPVADHRGRRMPQLARWHPFSVEKKLPVEVFTLAR
jgi:hypothetical protein